MFKSGGGRVGPAAAYVCSNSAYNPEKLAAVKTRLRACLFHRGTLAKPTSNGRAAAEKARMSQVIALVDDDRNILTSVSIALQAEGFVTRVYSDGGWR